MVQGHGNKKVMPSRAKDTRGGTIPRQIGIAQQQQLRWSDKEAQWLSRQGGTILRPPGGTRIRSSTTRYNAAVAAAHIIIRNKEVQRHDNCGNT